MILRFADERDIETMATIPYSAFTFLIHPEHTPKKES